MRMFYTPHSQPGVFDVLSYTRPGDDPKQLAWVMGPDGLAAVAQHSHDPMGALGAIGYVMR